MSQPVYKKFCLILIRDVGRNEVLLGMKKRGFAEGKWNGFGGKIEPGETPVEAAHRELFEESSLKCDKLTRLAVIHCDHAFPDKTKHLEVHLFISERYKGTLTESEEMRPKWFKIDGDIPYGDMWADDVHWWPYYLRRQPFKAHFKFNGWDQILEHTIEEVDRWVENERSI